MEQAGCIGPAAIQAASRAAAGAVYKIKLRDAGYRLVYEVNDAIVTVLVLAVAKRDKNAAYTLASRRR